MKRALQAFLQFVVLFVFWLLLSDQYDALFIGMGVVSAALVTYLTHHLVVASLALGEREVAWRTPTRVWRAVVWAGWMVGRATLAGVQVAYFVLHPRLPLEPGLLRFRAGLQSPAARVMLATSITLVPGTMTVRLDGDEYLVHALVPSSADDLCAGRLQTIVGRIFLEGEQPAPDVVWETAREVER
jgi:multicomponent Na+:H+ antiporter subunit E